MSPPTPAAPAPAAPAPAAPAPSEPARPARWVDRLTGFLLLGTVTLLVGALTPPVLRALGVGAPRSPVLRAERLPLPQREAEPAPHHRRGNFEFDFSDRDEDDDDPHRGPSATPRIPNLDGTVPSPEPTGGSPAMGIARREFSLFADPDPESAPLGRIEAGNQVMVMRESGEWALVIRTGAEGILMGWARRSEIAVR